MANTTFTIRPSADGNQYSQYPAGNYSPVISAPTSVSAVASGPTVNLSWINNLSGSNIEVQRRTTVATPWVDISTVLAGISSYADQNLPDGEYTYRIRSVLGADVSPYSSFVTATVSSGEIILPSANLVIEYFETSDLTPSGTTPDLNVGGLFTWDGTNYTSIVGMPNGIATRLLPLPTVEYPGQDFTPVQGSRCMRVRYNDDIMMAEQRFSLGAHYTDIWFRYWITIPATFYYRGANAKWAAFWTQGYDGAGDVTFQLRPQGSGNAKLVVQDGGVAVPEADAYADFINAARDAGRKMQIVYHLRPESTNGASNGQIRVWRRWQGDVAWAQIYNKTNAGFFEGGVGVHQGYLLGSAESNSYVGNGEHPYLIDVFEVSTASLV